jgi:hypothetical protein
MQLSAVLGGQFSQRRTRQSNIYFADSRKASQYYQVLRYRIYISPCDGTAKRCGSSQPRIVLKGLLKNGKHSMSRSLSADSGGSGYGFTCSQ